MGLLAAALAAPGPPAGKLPEVLVSRQLLAAQGLRVGDVITLSARAAGPVSPADRRGGGAQAAVASSTQSRFRIAGVYEPVPDPSRLGAARLEARLHLPDLLALTADPGDPLAAESVTLVNVALVDATKAPAFGRAVAARLPGALAHTTGGRGEGVVDSFVVLERFHLAIAIVTLVGSTIFLLALMVMLVDERRDMVAILRLIGLRRRRILLQILFEGLLIAVAGAAFGVLLSILTQGAFNRFFQWRYDTALVFVRVTPRIVQRTLVLAIPFGLGASLISSWGLVRREVLALARR